MRSLEGKARLCMARGVKQGRCEALLRVALRAGLALELTAVRILVAIRTSALGAAENLHAASLLVTRLALQLRMGCAQCKACLRMAQRIELRGRKVGSAMAVRTSLRSKLACMRVLVASGASLRGSRRPRCFQPIRMALRASQACMRCFERKATGRMLLGAEARLRCRKALVLAAVALGTTQRERG